MVLVRTDGSGRAWPVMGPTEPLEPKGGRRKQQMVSFTNLSIELQFLNDFVVYFCDAIINEYLIRKAIGK